MWNRLKGYIKGNEEKVSVKVLSQAELLSEHVLPNSNSAEKDLISNNELEDQLKTIENYYTKEEANENYLVTEELKKLPIQSIPREVIEKRLEHLCKVNNCISLVLARNAMKYYKEFTNVWQNIGLIGDQCCMNYDKVVELRKKIQNKKNMSKNLIKITNLLERRKKISSVLHVLNNTSEKIRPYIDLTVICNETTIESLHKQYTLIQKAKLVSSEDKQLLRLFPTLIKLDLKLIEKEQKIQDKIRQSLEIQMISFNSEQYQSVLKAFYQSEFAQQKNDEDFIHTKPISLTKELPKIIYVNIKALLKLSLKETLTEMIKYSESEDSTKIFQNLLGYLEFGVKMKSSNLALLINKDIFCEYIRRLYHNMSNYMYNNHCLIRYHQEIEMNTQEEIESDYFLYLTKIKEELFSLRKKNMGTNIKKNHKIDSFYN